MTFHGHYLPDDVLFLDVREIPAPHLNHLRRHWWALLNVSFRHWPSIAEDRRRSYCWPLLWSLWTLDRRPNRPTNSDLLECFQTLGASPAKYAPVSSRRLLEVKGCNSMDFRFPFGDNDHPVKSERKHSYFQSLVKVWVKRLSVPLKLKILLQSWLNLETQNCASVPPKLKLCLSPSKTQNLASILKLKNLLQSLKNSKICLNAPFLNFALNFGLSAPCLNFAPSATKPQKRLWFIKKIHFFAFLIFSS